MTMLFQSENSEELVAIARLSLNCVDHLIGSVHPDDAIPSPEIGALLRLISGALDLGLLGARPRIPS